MFPIFIPISLFYIYFFCILHFLYICLLNLPLFSIYFFCLLHFLYMCLLKSPLFYIYFFFILHFLNKCWYHIQFVTFIFIQTHTHTHLPCAARLCLPVCFIFLSFNFFSKYANLYIFVKEILSAKG